MYMAAGAEPGQWALWRCRTPCTQEAASSQSRSSRDSASHTQGLWNSPQKQQVPGATQGLGSAAQRVRAPSEHSPLPLTPQLQTNVPPQLVPSTETIEGDTHDILPKRSQATLGFAITKKSLPSP